VVGGGSTVLDCGCNRMTCIAGFRAETTNAVDDIRAAGPVTHLGTRAHREHSLPSPHTRSLSPPFSPAPSHERTRTASKPLSGALEPEHSQGTQGDNLLRRLHASRVDSVERPRSNSSPPRRQGAPHQVDRVRRDVWFGRRLPGCFVVHRRTGPASSYCARLQPSLRRGRSPPRRRRAPTRPVPESSCVRRCGEHGTSHGVLQGKWELVLGEPGGRSNGGAQVSFECMSLNRVQGFAAFAHVGGNDLRRELCHVD
jgi:hypothetical protein